MGDGQVYLQTLTLAAFDQAAAALRRIGREGRQNDNGRVSIPAVQAMLGAVQLLDRLLQDDLTRAVVQAWAPPKPDGVSLRWASRCDARAIAEIETLSPQKNDSQDEVQIGGLLDCGNVRAIVADCDGRVVGSLFFAVGRGDVGLMNMAVHPDYRRRGIARVLLSKALGKLSSRRQFCYGYVHEDNLASQQFLKACGFTYRGTANAVDMPDGTSGDVYRFEYRWPQGSLLSDASGSATSPGKAGGP